MFISELTALLFAVPPEATIVTTPTSNSAAPVIHSPCLGTGFINGIRDAACDGTGQVYTKPLVRITAGSGVVTVNLIPTNP